MVNDKTLTPSGRVGWYLRKLWLGSQTKMARDTGLSQAAISKVVLGRRNPGRQFLLAVAGHPLVNGAWLLSGVGEPLLQSGGESGAGELMLPLVTRLLPGPVDQLRDRLSEAFVPVLRGDFAATRYWYRISHDDQVDDRLIAGDILLVETDRSWLRRPERLKDVWCAVVPAPEAKPRLGWVDKYKAEMGVIVRPWSEPASSNAPRVTPRVDLPRRALKRKPVPANDVDANTVGPSPMSPVEPKQGATLKRETARPAHEGLPLSAVVGVVVLMQRRWAWW